MLGRIEKVVKKKVLEIRKKEILKEKMRALEMWVTIKLSEHKDFPYALNRTRCGISMKNKCHVCADEN